MADLDTLLAEIRAAVPSTVRPEFGVVDANATPPWTVVRVSLPTIEGRRLDKSAGARRVQIRCRIVAANEQAVWQLGDILTSALEGHRIESEDWDCGPIEWLNSFATPYPDQPTVATATNAHLMNLPLDFDFFIAPKPTEEVSDDDLDSDAE